MKSMRYLWIGLAVFVLGCASSPNGEEIPEQKPKPKKQRAVVPDPNFSLNMASVPDDWPLPNDWSNEDEIAIHQEKVYHEYGTPDYYWLFWRRDEQPMTHREFQNGGWINRKNKLADDKEPLRVGWVYLDDKAVFTFTKKGAKKQDFTDQMRVITEYGDPHEIKDTVDMQGRAQVSYQYYDEGKVFYFTEGRQTKVDSMPRLEGFYDRR